MLSAENTFLRSCKTDFQGFIMDEVTLWLEGLFDSDAEMFWKEYYRHVNEAFPIYRSYFEVQAKSYLLVCQRLGILPIHSEHWSQVMARRNERMHLWDGWSGSYSRWVNCPLPPPIGLS